jgi:branched-chain amino acid transport system permease protein
MGARRYVPLVVVAALVVGVENAVAVAGTPYYLTQLTMAAYYCLVAAGLCLLMGHAGQISLGHAGFFALGAYTSAALTTHNLLAYAGAPWVRTLRACGILSAWRDVYGTSVLSVAPWAAFAAAMALTLAVAFLLGRPIIRLRGHYLAMATLGFGMIVYRIAVGTDALGRSDGLVGVPPFTLFGGAAVGSEPALRPFNYYFAWGLVLVGAWCVVNLVNSRVGRALQSIHGNEAGANALGIDTTRYKVHAFVLSAVFAAAAGSFLTHYNGSVGPTEASVMKSVRYVAIVAVGGMANLWGVLLMGALLNFLSLRGVFGSYDDAVFGCILILVMLFAPRGLVNAAQWKSAAAFFRARSHGRRTA